MSSQRPPNYTLRVPPDRTGEGQSGMVAVRLRERPIELDDVGRARMERALVQAWRTHAAARVPLPRASRRGEGASRARFAISLAAAALLGGVVAFYSAAGGRSGVAPALGSARFELRIGDAAVQSGSVVEGEVLESGKHGRIDVDLSTARLGMERDTRMRFDRMSASELVLSLLKGTIDVDFHPRHKGEQRMLIETGAARVQVVGTRFRVQVDGLGNTEVSVTEGVVEVVPRSGGAVRRVSAGQHTYVRVDDGDEYERAVRDAIERAVGSGEAPTARADKPDMVFSADEPEAEVQSPSLTPPRAIAHRLQLARRLLRQGHHVEARARLRGLGESPTPIRFRIEALTLTAESYTAQGDVPHATQAYRRADELAPTDPAGHNARFALARLLERYAHDDHAAASAYRRYLERAPKGALASQARQALCRLGDESNCGE